MTVIVPMVVAVVVQVVEALGDVAVGLLSARPVEALLGARLLLAVHQRQRCRRLVGAADDSEQLQQVQARLGLR